MKPNFHLAALALLFALFSGKGDAAQPTPTLKSIAEGFVQPTAFEPIDEGRALIADQLGKVFLLQKDGKLSDKLVLDLGNKLSKYNTNAFDERGLVGIAAHPQFAANRRFFVCYTAPLRESAPTNFDHTARVSEFTLTKNDTGANERALLEIDMPYFNHHSGRMAFGPDGLLYVAIGDGGNRDDVGRGHSPQGNGQDTSKLMGKVLRLDVNSRDRGKPYAVPNDNPFVKGGGAPEIFAYGFRNPWGLSFDRGGTRELFVTDVGQESWEEINIVKKGGNYGWNIREGFVCFDPKKPKDPPADCPKVGANGEPLIDPVLAYKNFRKFTKDPEAKGISITGGYIYRGKALPQLAGKYIFADWSRSFVKPDGVLYTASRGADGQWTMNALALTDHADGAIGQFVTAFGEDADGELYVLTNTSSTLRGTSGKVWKLVAQ